MQVPEFIAECVERWGGAVAARGSGLFDVLLPPELERVFGRELMAVAAEPAALRTEPDAELAVPGSRLVDQLISVASARGTAAIARLPAGRLRRSGLRQEVERTLRFSNCRVRHEETEPRVMDARYVQFNFRVTFLSDEKRERMHAIPVDLGSNLVNLALAERLADLAPTADDVTGTEAIALPADLAYASAQATLRTRVADEARLHRERIEKRFGVEYARVVAYFDQMTQELHARRGDNTQADANALEHKLIAVASERERKLRELGEKHQLRVRARLASTRLLVQAKTFFTVLVDRGATTRAVTLCYDSLLERLEPPACDACHRETTRVQVDAGARLLCAACAGLGSV